MLTEHQVPFDCVHDLALSGPDVEQRLSRYDLLILPDVACLSDQQADSIDAFVEQGGHVLATGATGLFTERGRPRDGYALGSLGAVRAKTTRANMRAAYLRIGAGEGLAHLPDTALVFLDGAMHMVETRPGATSSLTLVPPCTYGPPEKVAIDQVETDVAGLLWYDHHDGRTAYFPWAIDVLYYRHSSPAHAGLYISVLRALSPEPQVLADACPQLEVGLFAHRDRGYLLNLVNLSGHHGTAFFPPLPIHDLQLRVRLPEAVHAARSLHLGQDIPLAQEGSYTALHLPVLNLFDTLYLQ
jgi:hypothetical protein